MKYVFREYDKDLIPVMALPTLVVSDDAEASKVLLNFLAQDVRSGVIELRGKYGFPINFPQAIERVKSRIADKPRERNPLQALASDHLNREGKQQLMDGISRSHLQDFVNQGYLTKSDLSVWMDSKGIKTEWQHETHGFEVTSDAPEAASEMTPAAESDACLERKEADPLSNDDESHEQAESIEGANEQGNTLSKAEKEILDNAKTGKATNAKKNRPPDHFCKALKDLLNSIELRSKAKGKAIDFSAMPGTCANLHDLACKVSSFPKLKLSTFQKYQKKSRLCSFNNHAVNSSFYKELFPELFK